VKPCGILELCLRARPLAALRAFYGGVLSLPVTDEEGAIAVRAGATRLVFLPAAPDGGDPVYHFAFDVPENRFDEARRWAAARVPLVRRCFRTVTHFRSWNAHSVYFRDPAGNVLELIARHDLPNATAEPFSAEHILYASEIGLAVDDVRATVADLERELGLRLYRRGRASFAPVGDPRCLLIVVRKGYLWLPTHDVRAAAWPVGATFAGDRSARFAPPGDPYSIVMVPG
jgi:catechol 2,3-dioxygenase-like lactoylglutathione lyase family enzyme